MKAFIIRSLAVVAVGAGLVFTLRAEQPTEEQLRNRAAQNEIVKLSDHLDARDVAERAQKIVKEHRSEDISSIFRHRNSGGLGVGNLIQAGYQDGIERFINLLARKKNLSEADLEKYNVDYLRIAKVLQAMAELAPFRASENVKKDPVRSKEWAKVVAEFKSKTAEFRQAIDATDPKRVRLAALTLHHTCCECHSLTDF